MGKNKKQKIKRPKLLLDTSIQISRYAPDIEGSILRFLPKDGALYTSHFVLYEFKTGFIRNMVEFYYRVKLYNSPSLALAWWSKKFGKRELKNILILQALMARITNSISTGDTKNYLRLIEGIIFDLITNFDTDILMVGDFAGDEIVKFEIKSSEDYENFLTTYNARKTIPLVSFWKKHTKELKKIISKKEVFEKSKIINKLYAKLIEIDKNIANSNKYAINKAIGDVVIATDCPINLILTTLDKSFNELCPILEKNYLNILEKQKS